MAGALGNQTIIKKPKTPRADGNHEEKDGERDGEIKWKRQERETDEREKMEKKGERKGGGNDEQK